VSLAGSSHRESRVCHCSERARGTPAMEWPRRHVDCSEHLSRECLLSAEGCRQAYPAPIQGSMNNTAAAVLISHVSGVYGTDSYIRGTHLWANSVEMYAGPFHRAVIEAPELPKPDSARRPRNIYWPQIWHRSAKVGDDKPYSELPAISSRGALQPGTEWNGPSRISCTAPAETLVAMSRR